MPPPISGSSMPPHPSTGPTQSFPGSYPNSSGPSIGGQHPSHHSHPSMGGPYGNNLGGEFMAEKYFRDEFGNLYMKISISYIFIYDKYLHIYCRPNEFNNAT